MVSQPDEGHGLYTIHNILSKEYIARFPISPDVAVVPIPFYWIILQDGDKGWRFVHSPTWTYPPFRAEFIAGSKTPNLIMLFVN